MKICRAVIKNAHVKCGHESNILYSGHRLIDRCVRSIEICGGLAEGIESFTRICKREVEADGYCKYKVTRAYNLLEDFAA